MNVISKSDIVNSRITAIHVVGKEIDDCSYATTYFSIDRGFSFRMPSPGAAWHEENVPPEAEELLPSSKTPFRKTIVSRWLSRLWPKATPKERDVIQEICERRIIDIRCPDRDVEDLFPDDVFMVFDDGSQLDCLTVAPRGIPAGFRFFSAGEAPFELEDSIDFFEVPLL